MLVTLDQVQRIDQINGVLEESMNIQARYWLVIFTIMLALHGMANAHGKHIVAAGDHDFPPYEFIDEDGNAAGLNVDLLNAIAEKVGLDVEFRLGPWDIGRENIVKGEIDVLPMYIADFRTPEIDFATPHVIIYHEIFIRKSAPALRDISDLEGRSVIVQKDAWVHESLVDMGLEIDLVLVESEREALQLLADSLYDASLVSEVVGRRILREHELDTLTTSGPPLFPVEYALAVRSDNTELLAMLNEGLDSIKASGQFNRIHERWLGRASELAPAPPQRPIWPFMVLILVVIIVLFGWLRIRDAHRSSAPRMEHDFLQDAMTGLPNRLGLEERLSEYLKPDRSSSDSCALIHLDIDQFKLVNESTDYQSGDELINEIAELLESRFGNDGFLARPGSDEFCLLLDMTDEARAREQAESVRQALERHEFRIGGELVNLTASIGVAVIDDHIASIGEMLKRAEAACHAAKEAGRNRVHLYHPEDEAVAQRHGQMRWVREVVLALKEDRLELHYQRIEPARADPQAGLIIEILLRMRMTDGQVVAAGEFVPAAEKYFIAHRVDRWVLRSAFKWLEQHRKNIPGLERAFINISARSLGDDRFLPFVLEQFEHHDVPPELIGFELTETAMMTHLQTGLRTIDRLRRLGCQFALDDFGVGSSSMAYLKQLPVDVLKIDGSFSRGAISNRRERTLLTEINGLGHVLGKITVAEHVETEEIRNLMAEIGIDRVQGWAIGRPEPLDELLLGRDQV
jgi:diguanylate cyclase (GGDEF)-like protein